ncbi:VWA domain-containing protein [Rhizobium lemnae]|uniref:VWA domain-containing protein n=1 Tax=Rhizobium lemnae TaxID=1214924 RepID=A0ABV8EAM4_9HYPH|nr:VWA domain-containing protein [Rhizobium lemnae]MCJ8510682.1 VWA domain-containing protein [Rhizobium lemnae]
MKKSLWNLIKDRSGNFGVVTAILLPVCIGTASFGIDFANALQVKADLQGAADAAALSAASAMAKESELTEEEAKKKASDYLAAQFAAFIDPDEKDANTASDIAKKTQSEVVSTGTEATGKTYSVTVRSSFDVPTSGLASIFVPSIRVSVEASASSSTERHGAFSMYLVLDRSASMIEYTNTLKAACSGCWLTYVSKIEALKSASDALIDTIKDYDPDSRYTRLGAVSYNEVMQPPTPLDWNTDATLSYVNALTPFGFTNSGEAMQTAYKAVTDPMEDSYHKNKNGQDKPRKFIIFMTDGVNNILGADTKTKAACTAAKADGVEIFTVALMAPDAGKALLSACATDNDHYFDAQNAVDLVAAFQEIAAKASQKGTLMTN